MMILFNIMAASVDSSAIQEQLRIIRPIVETRIQQSGRSGLAAGELIETDEAAYFLQQPDDVTHEIAERIFEWYSTALYTEGDWGPYFQEYLSEIGFCDKDLDYLKFLNKFRKFMRIDNIQEDNAAEQAQWIAKYLNHCKDAAEDQVTSQQPTQETVSDDDSVGHKSVTPPEHETTPKTP